MTRTVIELTETTFNEICEELILRGRPEAVVIERDRTVSIDMHGICLLRKAPSNVVDFPPRKILSEEKAMEFSPDVLKGFE